MTRWLALVLLGGAVTAIPAVAATRGRGAPRRVAAVGVQESEYRITLTRSAVAHGRVVIELRNRGEDPHDMRLRRADGRGPELGFALIRPGALSAAKLALGRGEWRLWCTLPGHEAAGMHATLTVR